MLFGANWVEHLASQTIRALGRTLFSLFAMNAPLCCLSRTNAKTFLHSLLTIRTIERKF
jgi:hypothetical protein